MAGSLQAAEHRECGAPGHSAYPCRYKKRQAPEQKNFEVSERHKQHQTAALKTTIIAQGHFAT